MEFGSGMPARVFIDSAAKERRKALFEKAEQDYLNAQKDLEQWKTKRSQTSSPQPASFIADQSIPERTSQEYSIIEPPAVDKPFEIKEYSKILPKKEENVRTSSIEAIASFNSNENFISKKEHDRILQQLAIKHSQELEMERNHGIGMLTKKAEEFEKLLANNDKMKEIKFKQQHKSVEQLEKELLDLQTAVHQYRLNEEIMKKQYHALVLQGEKQIKEYVDNLAKAREEIEYYRIAKPQEIGEELNAVRARVEHMNCQLEFKNREIKEKDQQVLLLHSKFQDKERVFAQLEQKILTLEQEQLKQKEQEFAASALKFNLEDERRRRETIENDYNLLLKDSENIRQRLRREVELEYRQEIEMLDAKNQQLKSEIEKLLYEKNEFMFAEGANLFEGKKCQLENELSELENLRQIKLTESTSEHIEGMKNYYEKKCKSLQDEATAWKNKAGELVSKYYSALKSLRSKVHHLKADTLRKQAVMRDEFDDSINQIMAKYGRALRNADAIVQALTQKLSSVPEKRPGKIKTCKKA